jgi:hypothetical protein
MHLYSAICQSHIVDFITVFGRPGSGLSFVWVRPRLNSETQKSTVENEGDESRSTTCNLHLIPLPSFLPNEKN